MKEKNVLGYHLECPRNYQYENHFVFHSTRALLFIFTKKKKSREQEIIKEMTFVSERKILFFIVFF